MTVLDPLKIRSALQVRKRWVEKRKDHQDQAKMIFDTAMGIAAEALAYWVIPGLSPPDLRVYESTRFEHDAEFVIDGISHPVSIKSMIRGPYRDSVVFQKSDTTANSFDYLVVVGREQEMFDDSFVGHVSRLIRRGDLVYSEMRKPELRARKHCVYLDQISGFRWM